MNLKELAKTKGTNIKRIAETCGIPASTLYAISSGETTFDNVGIGAFRKVAAELGMTSDELYANVTNVNYMAVRLDDITEDKPSGNPDEQRLVELYRAMDADYREMLMKSAVAYAAMSEKDRDGSRVDVERAGIALS